MAFFYIVPLSDLPAFKIGKSSQPNERFGTLGKSYVLDCSRAILVDCGSADAALDMESMVYRACKRHHFFSHKEGGTELFQMSVLDEAASLARTLAQLHSYEVSLYTEWEFSDVVIGGESDGTDISVTLKTLGKRLRTRRLALNMTQQQVATKLNLGSKLVTQIENTGNGRIKDVLRYLRLVGLGYDCLTAPLDNPPSRKKAHSPMWNDRSVA